MLLIAGQQAQFHTKRVRKTEITAGSCSYMDSVSLNAAILRSLGSWPATKQHLLDPHDRGGSNVDLCLCFMGDHLLFFHCKTS